MQRRFFAAVVFAFVAILAASLPARSEGVGQQLGFKIAFDFAAGEKSFKAGDYVIKDNSTGNGELSIQRTDGKFHHVLSAVTRLARQHQGDAPKASLVFDRVGDKLILSEIWLPMQDGYLLRPTKEAHEHEVVDVK